MAKRRIDCSNNSAGFTGPWCLGIPDTFSLDAVYIGNTHTYANTGTNYANYFTLDNGQRDSHYDFATITLGVGQKAIQGNLLVILDYYATTGGDGYYSVMSYLSPVSSSPENYASIPT